MHAQPTSHAPTVVTVRLIAIGVALTGVGAIYLFDTAGHLPSFFAGHQSRRLPPNQHALHAFGLALMAFLGAWMRAGRKAPN